jgi:hypothetical protein
LVGKRSWIFGLLLLGEPKQAALNGWLRIVALPVDRF